MSANGATYGHERQHAMMTRFKHETVAYGDSVGHLASVSAVIAQARLKQAREFMLAHLDQDIGLEQTAAACGMSINHFVRVFRRHMGTTPHRWLISQRLEVAMRLMQDPEQALASIAASSGFADQSHLTRVFAERIGTTPGQWRRAHFDGCKADRPHSMTRHDEAMAPTG